MSDQRCFIGVPLDTAALARACEARERVTEFLPAWRSEKWVAEKNLHVTVRFLGQLEPEGVERLRISLAAALAGTPAFVLPLGGVVPRPNARRSRMLWLSATDPEGRFAGLCEAVAGAVDAVGIPGDERRQLPHVTLCRARSPRIVSPARIDEVNEVWAGDPLAMSVPRVTLFSSQLGSAGPRYETIESWEL